MTDVVMIVIYTSIFLFLYNYLFYPVFIISLSRWFKKDTRVKMLEDNELPAVSFIIAAYNEEKVIAKKIENTLAIDYPKDIFQIIVVSDGSSDDTNKIVSGYSEQSVIGLHEDERKGKSAALNRGVELSTGEIIIFSDANNDFSRDSVRELVKHFSDKNIGAVTGAKHIYDSSDRQSSKGDGLYWKYESKIKQAESDLGSITGAEGEILAIRKSLFKPIDVNLINDDAAITFSVIKSGHRIIYEKNAKAFEEASKDLIDDFNVKVRMAAGAFQTLTIEKKYIFPPKNWFSFTFISHKVLRWFAPYFLLLMFFLPILKLERIDMLIFFVLQVIFYVISLYAWLNRDKKLNTLLYVPMYFTVMNLALLRGGIRFLSKNTQSIWKKAER